MVVKKRVDNGFDGYRVPVVPRAPRSVRKRGSQRNSEESIQLCAFELLAAVAGKLLQETESSVSSTAAEGIEQFPIPKLGIKKEVVEGETVRSECLDQGSCTESLFVPELVTHDRKLKTTVKELPNAKDYSALDHSSVFPASSDFLKKAGYDVKLEIPGCENTGLKIATKPERCSPDYASLENGVVKPIEAVEEHTGHSHALNTRSLK